MSDMVEGGAAANSTIFPTTSLSIVAWWLAAWQLDNAIGPGHKRNT
jgi:hypothetical protein